MLLEEAKEKKFFEEAILYVGDREGEVFTHCIGADEKTLFDMASLTKIMSTTMVALKMIEEGKLCLFDRLDYFFEVPKDKEEITIQQLMTHTAGFEPFFDIEKEAKTPHKALETIFNRPLYSSIGKEVYYSCVGYIVLGKILEKVGGAPLDYLAKEYVFSPLGLKNTTYKPQGENIAPTEYDDIYGGHLKGVTHDENARFLGVSGNAGLFSNIEDVVTFTKMLARKGLYKDEVYLSEAMFSRAIYPYTKGMKELRGLGFSLYDYNLHPSGDLFSQGSFGHTGFTGTSVFVDKEKGVFVIFLTNRVFHGREDTGFLRFRRQLHNVIVSTWSKKEYNL